MNVLAIIFMAIVGAIVFSIIGGFFFMVTVGAAHSYNELIPALGFAESFFLTLALRAATTEAKAS